MFQAGQLGTIDMFSISRYGHEPKCLWRNPDKVSVGQLARMNAFWLGLEGRAYTTSEVFSVNPKRIERCDCGSFSAAIAENRWVQKSTRAFAHAHSKGATVYYLFLPLKWT